MKALTDAELLLLGLVAEMPRHGYQLDQVIHERGMREWTQIAFSSIYFVLGKLQDLGLVNAKKPARANAPTRQSGTNTAKVHASPNVPRLRSGPKARKVYSITPSGRRALAAQTIAALRDVRPAYSSVLVGMINWPALKRKQALQALHARSKAIEAELERLSAIQAEQQPLPDYAEGLFEFSLGQWRAEADWVARTLAYMSTKPWLE